MSRERGEVGGGGEKLRARANSKLLAHFLFLLCFLACMFLHVLQTCRHEHTYTHTHTHICYFLMVADSVDEQPYRSEVNTNIHIQTALCLDGSSYTYICIYVYMYLFIVHFLMVADSVEEQLYRSEVKKHMCIYIYIDSPVF